MGEKRKPRRPASTLEGKENQLISLAFDLVEKKLTNGTASSQEVTHFLKAGSTREKLEQRRIENENLLLAAKIESLASQKRIEELYSEALAAMRTYAGHEAEETYDDF